MKKELSSLCYIAKDKIEVDTLNKKTYISTENMLPDKSGISDASSLPTIKLTPLFKKNDILISNIRPYFKKIWYAEFDGGCSNDVLVLRAKPEVHDKFLYYVLSEDTFFDYATATAKGTKMPRGDKAAIMKYLVPDISYTEQAKISQILSSLDNKIVLNNKINENLEQQAQAIFKSWFVDYDHFAGTMPENWNYGELQDIANVTMGQSPSGSSYNESRMGEVFFQGRAEFGCRFPSKRLYTTEPKRMAKYNDILMSVRAPVGDINIVLENCCIGRGLAAINAKKYPSFVLYTLIFKKQDLNVFNGEGTVFGAINKDSLNSLKILIPAEKNIEDFEVIVSKLDNLIKNNCVENQNLIELRNSLLAKLINGEIDVSDINLDELSDNPKGVE